MATDSTSQQTNPTHPFALTGGGKLYVVDGVLVVVYDIGNGVKVYYDFSAPGSQQQVDLHHNYQGQFPTPLSDQAFYGQKNLIHGGMVGELADVTEPTFQAMIDKRLTIIAGGNASWLKDPEVRGILADAAANPDQVSDAEVQARIRQTHYWQGLSDQGRQWQNASTAQREQMVQTEAASLADSYLQLTGQQVDATSNYIRKLATTVASGTSNHGSVIENVIKKKALEDPHSPWAQQVQQIEDSRGQRGVDTSNQAETVRQTFYDWGMKPSENTINMWAQRIVAKKASLADLQNTVRQGAASLYPTKPTDMVTKDWAQPYMDAWSSVLERPPTDIFNADVQTALHQGLGLGEFQTKLRGDPRWANTSNGQQHLAGVAAQVGQKMGFSF